MPAPEKTDLLLDGPAGKIEALLEVPPGADDARVAVLCHPHPLYQGTMHNKVVHTLARALHDLGLATLRFNFRGVGKSEGVHDEGRGETADCLWLCDWLQQQYPAAGLWLAGFSFGGMVATLAAAQYKQGNIEQLVTIAPAVGFIKSGEDPEPQAPWLLVQGAADEVVDPDKVLAWVDTLKHRPEVVMLPDTGHFFHGQLVTLRNTLTEKLAD